MSDTGVTGCRKVSSDSSSEPNGRADAGWLMALLRYGYGRCGSLSLTRRGPFSLGTELLTSSMPRAVTTYKKDLIRITVVDDIL